MQILFGKPKVKISMKHLGNFKEEQSYLLQKITTNVMAIQTVSSAIINLKLKEINK